MVVSSIPISTMQLRMGSLQSAPTMAITEQEAAHFYTIRMFWRIMFTDRESLLIFILNINISSLHVITETGKNLTEGFYSTAPKKSYYLGCSGGGRQGMKAAEMFPKDFDGIVIGAPALNFNNMTSWRASFFAKTSAKNASNFISPKSWAGFIHDEVIRQCDTIDGVADGIIENPTACDFEPEALICAGNQTSGCLSSAQVEIVRDVLSPLYGSSGELVFPALQPGAEVLASTGLLSGSPWPYSLVSGHTSKHFTL